MEIRELQLKEAKAFLEHQICVRDKGINNAITKVKYTKWIEINHALFILGVKSDERLSDNKEGYVIQELNEGNGDSLHY